MYTYVTCCCSYFFFFNDTATTEIYTLSLHDALPIFSYDEELHDVALRADRDDLYTPDQVSGGFPTDTEEGDFDEAFSSAAVDRKSTRLNSSHANISYAVFCLKKKKQHTPQTTHMCEI